MFWQETNFVSIRSHLLPGKRNSLQELQQFGTRGQESYNNQVYTLEICNLTKDDVSTYKLSVTYGNSFNDQTHPLYRTIVLHLKGKILIL